MPGIETLTPRETEILALLARGQTNQGIALELGISYYTAITHVHNILGKLEAENRLQAARFWWKKGSKSPKNT